ncbi:alpha/beta-hydrolase [Hypoxylon trugodes]|uniref:alpha/beta-hydrolase n=1 Tax=Hypoxylon trugodes TaxID=326681 RepID=UPI00218F4D61|nr:alpha/beta-hydrolase [Hypoxylon trugodes]KAI1383861.1 alpha/beta-hydrolase [Hypoxylon trugodes]
MDRPLTTSEVPHKFLKTALLVGHVPHRVLASDPRVSYALYIPPEHYSHGAGLPPPPAKLPLLVSVHGTRRDVFDIYDLVPFAESTRCAVLTPLFPTGLDGPNDIDSYKVLRSKTLRSDLAFLSILDEVATRYPGIDAEKVFLMGFSGGGQFSHRILYLYPERLAAVSVGAPGRATFLNDQQDWPVGIKDVETLFERSINKDLIKKVPIHLVIGDEDVNIPGGDEFWSWLSQLKAQRSIGGVTDKKGKDLPFMEQGRLDTINDLRKSWKSDGIEAQLDVVPRVSHDARSVRNFVLAFLRPLIQGHLSN